MLRIKYINFKVTDTLTEFYGFLYHYTVKGFFLNEINH